MHEMSLCESVLQILEQEAVKQGFTEVRAVWLEIGALSNVVPEAMRFSFDAVTHNSLAEGAVLHILPVPGQGWCMSCDRQVAIKRRFDACPHCGHHPVRITAGEAMRIKELEVN